MTADDVTLTEAERNDLWTRYTFWEEGDDFREHMAPAVERILVDRLAPVQAEWQEERARLIAAHQKAVRFTNQNAEAAESAERRLAEVEAERDRAVRDVVALTENYVQPLATAEAERDDARRRLAEVEALAELYDTAEQVHLSRSGVVHDLRAALANPPAEESCDHPSRTFVSDAIGWECYDCHAVIGHPDEQDALAQHDAEVGARALREAADALDDHTGCHCEDGDHIRYSATPSWLRARADALTTEGQP